MSYPTRRARIEAEKAEQLALRSKRGKKFSLGVASLATAASATFFGMAPANAALDDVPAPSSSQADTASQSSSSAGTYTVQSGDTLSAIASSQGVSLNALMNANGLSASSIIYPGDVLKLSGSSSSSSSSSNSSQGSSSSAESAQFASASTVSTASASGPKAAAIDKAIDIVNSGASYVYGGNGPSAYDCSGFTKAAFAAAGIELPRTSSAQYSGAKSYVSLDNLQAGDLVFWSNNGSASGIYHVAVYVGDGKIAQARNPQAGITVNSLSEYTKYNPPLNTAARY